MSLEEDGESDKLDEKNGVKDFKNGKGKVGR